MLIVSFRKCMITYGMPKTGPSIILNDNVPSYFVALFCVETLVNEKSDILCLCGEDPLASTMFIVAENLAGLVSLNFILVNKLLFQLPDSNQVVFPFTY